MKVWWCEEHLCGNLPNSDMEDWPSPLGQGDVCLWAEEFSSETKCRMVEMQLVPTDARMVSGEAEVLERAAKALQDWDIDCGVDWWFSHDPKNEGEREYYRNGVRAVLDALSEPPPKDPWDYDP